MADNEITIPFIDGSGTVQQQESLVTGSGAVVPETALRANSAFVQDTNPLPTKKIVPVLTYSGPATLTVNTTSGVLIASGAYTRSVTIQTLPNSTGNIFLRSDGSAAVVNTGQCCIAGGGAYTWGTDAVPLPTGNITAITDGGTSQTIMVAGG